MFEEYDYFEVLYCESINTELEFEFNRLISIEFVPQLNDEGNYIYPNKLNN